MEDLLNTLGLSGFFHVDFGVPTRDQWPLFILSKWALVILPLYSVRYFGAASRWMQYEGPGGRIPGFRQACAFLEKFIAHAMFYVGMGIPIIGLDAVFDLPRLLGFTFTNMFIHEVLPIYLSKDRFRRLWPEWRRTLGVNMAIDTLTLEMSVFLNWRGDPVLRESPHSRVRNFVKSTRLLRIEKDGHKVTRLQVTLRRFFVPHGRSARFYIDVDPRAAPPPGAVGLGRYLRFDFEDLSDYAMPVYINDHGRQRWLWRPQYWTKFFNEVAGRSYETTPFEIIRKFFLVVCGTPVAFSAGNMLIHLQHGLTINLHPLLYFNYGIIFAFTIGGMYGASVFSTLIEVVACAGRHGVHKCNAAYNYLFHRRAWQRTSRSAMVNPHYRFDAFGALLERESPVYRQFRFLFGGIVMGGICAWGLTYLYGQSWDAFVYSNVQASLIDLLRDGTALAAESDAHGGEGQVRSGQVSGIHRGDAYRAVPREPHDGFNQMFLLHPEFSNGQ